MQRPCGLCILSVQSSKICVAGPSEGVWGWGGEYSREGWEGPRAGGPWRPSGDPNFYFVCQGEPLSRGLV